MKRVYQHPPESGEGRQYWRGLDELKNTPQFQAWLEREFPNGASELQDDDWSRRGFLKLMGASMALAGFGVSSCRRPEAHLVPFTKSAEWTIPGKALYYATAMPRRDGALPLIATTVDGRPIKLEGNPLHPASGGATDVFAQASIIDLYDPTRSRGFLNKGKPADRAAFDSYIEKLRTQLSGDGGEGLAFLVEEVHSPTRERLRACAGKSFSANALVRLQRRRVRRAVCCNTDCLRPQYSSHSATGSRRRDHGHRQRFRRLRGRGPRFGSRFHVPSSCQQREGFDEPPLRGRESLLAHWFDG